MESDVEKIHKVDQEAYLSLLRTKIQPSLHYQSWAINSNLQEVTGIIIVNPDLVCANTLSMHEDCPDFTGIPLTP